MRKDNTQNYQTSTSRISHFRDYTDNINSEKDDMETMDRQFIKNDDNIYNLPNTKRLKFNKVTRKMDDVSKDELKDTIKSLEDSGVKKDKHTYKIKDDAINPNHFFKNDTGVKESKIKSFEAFTGGFGYNNNEMTPKPDIMGNPDLGDDQPLEDDMEDDTDVYSDEMMSDTDDEEPHTEHNQTSYMFFGNLESLNRMSSEISEMDETTINQLLNSGHNWAEDHVSAAKEMVSQVYNFMINQQVEEGMEEGNNYMFFGNMKNIALQTEELLQLDETEVDGILNSGHDWAEDHMSAAKEDIQQVYEFLKSELE